MHFWVLVSKFFCLDSDFANSNVAAFSPWHQFIGSRSVILLGHV